MDEKTILQQCIDKLSESTAEAVIGLFIKAKDQEDTAKIIMLKSCCLHLIDCKWDITYDLLKDTDITVHNISKMHSENNVFRLLIEQEFKTLIDRSIAISQSDEIYI